MSPAGQTIVAPQNNLPSANKCHPDRSRTIRANITGKEIRSRAAPEPSPRWHGLWWPREVLHRPIQDGSRTKARRRLKEASSGRIFCLFEVQEGWGTETRPDTMRNRTKPGLLTQITR